MAAKSAQHYRTESDSVSRAVRKNLCHVVSTRTLRWFFVVDMKDRTGARSDVRPEMEGSNEELQVRAGQRAGQRPVYSFELLGAIVGDADSLHQALHPTSSS